MVMGLLIVVFIAGFALLTGYGMLTGRIRMRNLLHESATAGQLSPGRVKLLVLTLVGTISYLGLAMNAAAVPGGADELPSPCALAEGCDAVTSTRRCRA
jgi:hypothetical protein